MTKNIFLFKGKSNELTSLYQPEILQNRYFISKFDDFMLSSSQIAEEMSKFWAWQWFFLSAVEMNINSIFGH